jgi:hypothetical protein
MNAIIERIWHSKGLAWFWIFIFFLNLFLGFFGSWVNLLVAVVMFISCYKPIYTDLYDRESIIWFCKENQERENEN